MKQVTLVCLYGHKTKSLEQLIRDCMDLIQQSPLRRVFRPYLLSQIHGTIIGMEKMIGYSDNFNANIWSSNGNKTVMNFNEFLPTLHQHFPMTVQIGGFGQEFNKFDSFGHSPYERSFQVQWVSNRFTIIGWPHSKGDYTTVRKLNKVRDALGENCNIKHKYSGDNDLFIVLGEIVNLESFTDEELAQFKMAAQMLETEVRNYLSATKLDVTIDLDAVSVAQYELETLALSSTVAHRITNPGISSEFFASLYS